MVLSTLNKVTSFSTDIDALNYMRSINWSQVAVRVRVCGCIGLGGGMVCVRMKMAICVYP
jgi:hypothetical protein